LNRPIRSLAFSGSNLVAGTDNGLFISTNNGLNWIESGLSDQAIFSIAVNENIIFAGTYNGGIFMSTNNGITWLEKNQGFSSSPYVHSLFTGNGYIFAGMHNQSVWTASYSLEQNYPNPFNPSTKISYKLRSAAGGTSYVKLVVYDVLGKEVVKLVNENQLPGTYEIEFDGRGLPSGVYFYRLTTGEFTDTKRMMLVK